MENLTALEYSFKRWKIYHYNHDRLSPFFVDEDLKEMGMNELIASITDVDLEPETEEIIEEHTKLLDAEETHVTENLELETKELIDEQDLDHQGPAQN